MMHNTVIPSNYRVRFDVDMEKSVFYGSELIRASVRGGVERISLDSLGLKISSCRVRSGGKEVASSSKTSEKKEKLEILLGRKVSGSIEILLEFEGRLEGGLSGFYRSVYRDKGKTCYMATTHFEPADARRAFPCFDRPDMKATFDMSIAAGKEMKAISNMPVKAERAEGNRKIFEFERTPRMSTYLVYLGVGDFEFIEGKAEGVKIRIATVPGKSGQGKFAMDCARKFLGYYNKYFGIKYPLPKLDLIAVPDFAAGAMENWGAITFREIELLFDPDINSSQRQQRIAKVIAHEMAHMWFGDLVTMKWWNDLWLNESFATWIEYKAVDRFFPEWESWKQFLDEVTEGALGLDSMKSSHPIEADVRKPQEISEIFDLISYSKGGSVIRMLEDFMGEETFRKGLELYMKRHKYGNATTEDLWAALRKASGIDVKKMMSGWIKQAGYPMIEVEKKGPVTVLSQKRFLMEGDDKASVWEIPVKAAGFSFVMDKPRKEIRSKDITKLNSGQTGFYRVSYNDALGDFVPFEKNTGDMDKWGLQSDLFALAMSCRRPFDDYLDFIKNYSDERDYMVCRDISQSLYYIYLLSGGKLRDRTREAALRFNSNVIGWLGWKPKEKENKNYSTLRSSAIISLARMGNTEAVNMAEAEMKKILYGKAKPHPDMAGLIYSAAAWGGGRELYERMKKRYKESDIPEEQRRLLIALSSFSKKDLLQDALDFSVSSDVRPQDTFVITLSVSGNPEGKDLVWPWLKNNWRVLEERYKGSSAKNLTTMVESVRILSDAAAEKDISAFFRNRPKEGLEMTLRQTLEKIRINRKFLKRNS